MNEEINAKIERIASYVYEDFKAGAISFEACEAALNTLTAITEYQIVFGVPEEE